MPRCFLGLGGNTGDVAATFVAAIEQLNRADIPVRVTRTSSIYRTAPIGSAAGDPYHNAVAEIESDLPPSDLLQLTQSVEQSFGRTHTVRWGPRPLDIDILLYGDEIVARPDLIIPHPHMWYRRFVLDPLVEIAPDVQYPQKKGSPQQRASIWQMRQRLLIRPFRVLLASPDIPHRDRLLAELGTQFPKLEFDVTGTKLPSGREWDETVVWLNPHDSPRVSGSAFGRGSSAGPLRIPDDQHKGLELLTAVITAATDVPEVISGPIPIAPAS